MFRTYTWVVIISGKLYSYIIMTPKELIAKIREKVIVACPDVLEKDGVQGTTTLKGIVTGEGKITYVPIGIAEILRTIRQMRGGLDVMKELSKQTSQIIFGLWDLSQDHLENQSPETLLFLYDLIKSK